METKQILVLGANGKTGSRVVERLEKLNLPVRKGSRSAVPKFDWEYSENWKEVLKGVSSIYITFQPDLAVEGSDDAIRLLSILAKEAGVEKLVLLSGRGEKEAEVCEKIIMESGLKWTIVRASWFSQNFSESFFLDPILQGHVSLPVGDVKEPFIDADDIADVVVASLTEEGHDGKLYEVTGSKLLSFREAVAEISDATGRTIVYEQPSIEEYVAQMAAYQIPKEYIDLSTYLFTEVLDGRNASISHGIEEALGRKPKDFSEYVKEIAASGLWNPQG
ncbi:NmrA family NAD(P)-binding protein [Flavobacterium microcysteis]|uniref:NmrA family transcriptional regulator n=1 Tax=Flavobacterium microcysteis TaxID=2596891 RepID=A0A501QG04_9FLAO|nr:NAD(P)H-binding protein [Flavobacterium microcysteis]TPD71810.1 NmrA family transcriptional regulator [Flavobacterium microcysteis]